MSPVWTHPLMRVLEVASGSFQYPFMTFSPLTNISPSSAIFTLTPWKSGRTVSNLTFSGGLADTTGAVSVWPYPCNKGNPRAVKYRPTSKLRADPPEIRAFNDPPNLLFTFLLTNLSRILFVKFSIKLNFSPLYFFFPNLSVAAKRVWLSLPCFFKPCEILVCKES